MILGELCNFAGAFQAFELSAAVSPSGTAYAFVEALVVVRLAIHMTQTCT